MAGSAEVGFNGGGRELLAGYRAAQYVGLGFGAFGILLAGVFLLQSKAAGKSATVPVPAVREEEAEGAVKDN